MVVGIFPVVKLGALFVKQISKPLAKLLVNQAKNHRLFRTYFIIPPAQLYHWMEVKTKMYIMNLGRPMKVAKLNEAMAIELGANLMGEIIIFTICGGCLVLEYNRQVAKETKKETARQLQVQQFIDDIDRLNDITSVQKQEIQYLQTAIQELAKHTKHKLSNPPDKPDGAGDNPRNSLEISTESYVMHSTQAPLIERAIQYFENDVKKNRLR